MEFHNRRNRRGRGRYVNNQPNEQCSAHNFNPPIPEKHWFDDIVSSFYTVFVVTSLIAVIYLMLEYHCTVCSAKNELGNITKSIDELSTNLSKINMEYRDLEIEVRKFSEELPKIQGQIDILESFANSLEEKESYVWHPKCGRPLPNVDIILRPEKKDGKNENNCQRISSNEILCGTTGKP